MINQYNPTCNNPEQQLTIDVDAHSSAEKNKNISNNSGTTLTLILVLQGNRDINRNEFPLHVRNCQNIYFFKLSENNLKTSLVIARLDTLYIVSPLSPRFL